MRLRLSTPVERIERHEDGVEVTPRGGEPERFDEVIVARALRPGTAHARRPERRRARGAGRDSLPAQRGGAALGPLAAAEAKARLGQLELPPARRAGRADHRDLPHEPPAVARNARADLRDSQPSARPSTRTRSSSRSPITTPSTPTTACGPRGASTRSAGKGARTTAARTGATASTRTACRARCGCAPASGACWRDAPAATERSAFGPKRACCA